jgi:para-nitrobenzyl esterase
MRIANLVLGAALALLAGSAAMAAPVKANLDSGVVVGSSEGGVNAFRGIPFAAPPVGALRWAPPKPAARWTGEREAAKSGPPCMQPGKIGVPNAGGNEEQGSEDCLTLQVFAPKGARRAPVMVWLHGGGNTTGSSALGAYDGSPFARDGVVLVAVNYRMGAFGFFAHPALTKAASPDAPLANYGLMDQIAALKWVQRNVAAFGGAPSNVTLFGESAGGGDTLSLIATPAAKGLFQRAIVESGGGWDAPADLPAAEKLGAALAVKAGAPADATLEQLRALPADALLKAGGRAGPVVDGRLVIETTIQAFARSHAQDVPLMIGSNDYEASLLAAVPPKMMLAQVSPSLPAAYAGEKLDERGLADAIATDAIMGGPARWIAARAATGSPSYLYYFAYVPEAQRSHVKGAGHATEIPFVFDSWATAGKILGGVVPAKADLEETAIMHGCWVSFAKHGRPEKCAPGGWPAYDPVKDQLYEFGVANGVRTHLRKPLLDAQEAAKADLLSGK